MAKSECERCKCYFMHREHPPPTICKGCRLKDALAEKGCAECQTKEAESVFVLEGALLCGACHQERRETVEQIIEALRVQSLADIRLLRDFLVDAKTVDG